MNRDSPHTSLPALVSHSQPRPQKHAGDKGLISKAKTPAASPHQAPCLISQILGQRDTLHNALYKALPFVEDAEYDPCLKPGYARKTARDIRHVIDSVEQAIKAASPLVEPVARSRGSEDACPIGTGKDAL